MATADTSMLNQSSFVDVVVSVNGQTATKNLKVCRVKVRSLLFIEVDRENRKNIFRKVNNGDIERCEETKVVLKANKIPKKWESAWDTIGTMPAASVNNYLNRPIFNNHSKGWAHSL